MSTQYTLESTIVEYLILVTERRRADLLGILRVFGAAVLFDDGLGSRAAMGLEMFTDTFFATLTRCARPRVRPRQ